MSRHRQDEWMHYNYDDENRTPNGNTASEKGAKPAAAKWPDIDSLDVSDTEEHQSSNTFHLTSSTLPQNYDDRGPSSECADNLGEHLAYLDYLDKDPHFRNLTLPNEDTSSKLIDHGSDGLVELSSPFPAMSTARSTAEIDFSVDLPKNRRHQTAFNNYPPMEHKLGLSTGSLSSAGATRGAFSEEDPEQSINKTEQKVDSKVPENCSTNNLERTERLYVETLEHEKNYLTRVVKDLVEELKDTRAEIEKAESVSDKLRSANRDLLAKMMELQEDRKCSILESQISDLHAELGECEASIQELNNEVEDKENIIMSHQRLMAQLEEKIKEMDDLIRKQAEDLESIQIERDDQIRLLKEEDKRRSEDLLSQISSLEVELHNYRSKIDDEQNRLRNKLNEAEKILASKDSEISTLQCELEEAKKEAKKAQKEALQGVSLSHEVEMQELQAKLLKEQRLADTKIEELKRQARQEKEELKEALQYELEQKVKSVKEKYHQRLRRDKKSTSLSRSDRHIINLSGFQDQKRLRSPEPRDYDNIAEIDHLTPNSSDHQKDVRKSQNGVPMKPPENGTNQMMNQMMPNSYPYNYYGGVTPGFQQENNTNCMMPAIASHGAPEFYSHLWPYQSNPVLYGQQQQQPNQPPSHQTAGLGRSMQHQMGAAHSRLPSFSPRRWPTTPPPPSMMGGSISARAAAPLTPPSRGYFL